MQKAIHAATGEGAPAPFYLPTGDEREVFAAAIADLQRHVPGARKQRRGVESPVGEIDAQLGQAVAIERALRTMQPLARPAPEESPRLAGGV